MAKSAAIGALIAVLCIAALLCVISLMMLFISQIPLDYAEYIMLAADAVGMFAGAYFAAVINGSRGLLTGLLCAFAVFIIMLIAGFASDGGTLTVITALRLVVLAVFGVLGGVKGVNRRERIHIR